MVEFSAICRVAGSSPDDAVVDAVVDSLLAFLVPFFLIPDSLKNEI